MERHSLTVIAGRRGYDAALPLGFRHGQDAVEGSALLEGSGRILEVVQLQINFVACQPGQGSGMHQRRFVDGVLDPIGGGFDAGEGQHAVHFIEAAGADWR